MLGMAPFAAFRVMTSRRSPVPTDHLPPTAPPAGVYPSITASA